MIKYWPKFASRTNGNCIIIRLYRMLYEQWEIKPYIHLQAEFVFGCVDRGHLKIMYV